MLQLQTLTHTWQWVLSINGHSTAVCVFRSTPKPAIKELVILTDTMAAFPPHHSILQRARISTGKARKLFLKLLLPCGKLAVRYVRGRTLRSFSFTLQKQQEQKPCSLLLRDPEYQLPVCQIHCSQLFLGRDDWGRIPAGTHSWRKQKVTFWSKVALVFCATWGWKAACTQSRFLPPDRLFIAEN